MRAPKAGGFGLIFSLAAGIPAPVAAQVSSGQYAASIPGLVDSTFRSQIGVPATAAATKMWVKPDGSVVLSTGVAMDSSGAMDTPFANNFSGIHGNQILAVQADGKCLAAAAIAESAGNQGLLNTFRLNADGSVDPTFNAAAAWCRLPLPNGQYLAQDGSNALFRLNADGSRDTGFAPLVPANGALVATPGYALSAMNEWAYLPAVSALTDPNLLSAVVDPGSGKIYLAYSGRLYRLFPDGTLDPAFNCSVAAVAAVAIRDGALLYASESTTYTLPSTPIFTIGRLTMTGSVDPDYSPQTIAAPFYVMGFDWAPDGSFYAAVSTRRSLPTSGQYPAAPVFQNTYREGIVRFGPDGKFDPSFSLNLDGQWTAAPTNARTLDEQITALAFGPDGKLYVTGSFTSFNGMTASGPVRLNLAAAAQPAVLANLSARGFAGTGDQALIGGFVVGNTGVASLLVRGIGPSLAQFGVTGVLPNAALTVFDAKSQPQVTATDWSSSADAGAIQSVSVAVGAFPLPAGSHDAAAVGNFGPGSYTFHVAGGAGETGAALAELYDADALPPPFGAAKLVNVSARSVVSADHPLIAGFVVAGNNTKRLLIRAVGPSLISFGVTGLLPDPTIQIYSGSTLLISQIGGAGNTAIAAAAAAVGAFALPPGAGDTALAVTLSPGIYTAQVTSASGTTGEALVEIYEVP